MKNFSSWLIAIFALMFWGFRLIGTVLYSIGSNFLFAPSDMTMEIILLFITFICICFIIKRKLLAALIYLVCNFIYYGPTFINHFMQIINETLSIDLYMATLFEFFGLVLAIAAIFDVLLDKSRKANPVDKNTDWFYKNKDYDRKLDERADKNNYRTL